MTAKKRILLKFTGEIFASPATCELDSTHLSHIIDQIKQLRETYQFGIVVGGGNFFRGNKHGKKLGMTAALGHQVGMLATMMNGLILKDLLEQQSLKTSLFCAVPCPEIGISMSQQEINQALIRDHIVIFTGGTGNPFFTTDTNAVIRGLQIEASQIWKGTNVDGIFDDDPKINPSAQFLTKITYAQALKQQLRIVDAAAFALAQQYNQVLRVFNILQENALLNAASDDSFGSTVFTE